MYYNLDDGNQVNLRGNVEAAKFVYLVMPFKGLSFVGERPHITVNADVRKIIGIHNIMVKRREEYDRKVNEIMVNLIMGPSFVELDDDIPF